MERILNKPNLLSVAVIQLLLSLKVQTSYILTVLMNVLSQSFDLLVGGMGGIRVFLQQTRRSVWSVKNFCILITPTKCWKTPACYARLFCNVTLPFPMTFHKSYLQYTLVVCLNHPEQQHSCTRPAHHLNVRLNISHRVLMSDVNRRGKWRCNCLFQAFQLSR